MAVYGQYETVAELGRSGSVSVYRARPADGGWELGFDELGSDAKYVLKVFQPRSAEDAGAGERRKFLGCVRSQKRAADAGAPHWAPILDAGESRGQAYYVTEYYPRSAFALARTASGRGSIDPQMLFALTEGTLLGLIELKRTQGRPHGNLKSTNVLVRSATGEVSAADVVLADLAPDQDATISGEPEDLYCVGELIYELVNGSKFPGQHTWPVKPSDRWDELGRHAEPWRELCNHLLSPQAAGSWIRVEDVLDEVQALRPRGVARRQSAGQRPRPRRLRNVVLVVLLTLAIAGGLGTLQYFRYQRQWRELCIDYANWFGPIAQSLEKQTPKSIADDPYLNQHLVQPLTGARTGQAPLDPREIAGTDVPVISLADRPPMTLSAMWKSERASRVIERVQQALSSGRWDALDDVTRRAGEYRTRGWTKLAGYAESLTRGLSPAPDAVGSADGDAWVASAAKLVSGHALLQRLDSARGAAMSRVAALARRGEASPMTKDKIDAFAANLRVPAQADAVLPSLEGVEALARSLESADEVAGKFEKLVPTLEDAARRERAYEVRGWAGPAKALASLGDRARPGENLDKLAADLSAARSQWEQVEARWREIEARRRLLESSGDRILTTYRNFVASHKLGEHSDLPSLITTLDKIDDDAAWAAVARRVAEPDWTQFDVLAFATRSETHRQFVGRSVATKADLDKWLAEAQGFESQLASATIKSAGNGKPGDTVVTTVPPPPATRNAQIAASTTMPATRVVVIATSRPTVPATLPSHPVQPMTAPTVIAQAKPPTTAPIAAAQAKPPATEPAPPPPPPITEIKIANANPRPGPKPVDVNVRGPNQGPAMQEVKIQPEVAAFILDSRNVGLPVSNREIKQAWGRNGELVAASVEKDARQFPALKAQRDKLRARFVQLDGVLGAISMPVELNRVAGRSAWNATLVRQIQAAKPAADAQVKELIGLAVAGGSSFETRLEAVRDADEQWRGAASRLVADANRLESLLAGGHVLSDRAVASALTGVRASELYKVTGVRESLDPVIKPVAAVENAQDPAVLRQTVASAQQPLGLQLTAWSVLTASKETPTLDLLEQDLKIGQELLGAAQATIKSDDARVGAIKASLESYLRTRWQTVMETASRPEDVQMAMAMLPRISGVDVDRLPARSRFNFALRDLRDAIAKARNAQELEKSIAGPVAKVTAVARELGADDRATPRVVALLTEAARMGQPMEVDFDKLGPRSVSGGGAVDWSVSVLEGGQVTAYRATAKADSRSGGELTLVFRRVKPSEASRASWVMTSEVSLGVFDSLLTAARKWPEVRAGRLLPDYDPARGDPRVGPRSWVWLPYARGNAGIRHSLVWLSRDASPAGVDHYPESIGSAENRTVIGDRSGRQSQELNPFNRRQPMQYVSARAAMLAAQVAGCRLPTAAEWRAAYASEEQNAAGANLRDRTWRLELEHMRRTASRDPRWRPDAGAFAPAGERPSDEVMATRDGAEYDDGVLWFRPVPEPAPQVFVDLVGNVAEFVADSAGGEAAVGVSVIGGSALSNPRRALDRPVAVAPEQVTSGFSDVGFRLAFSEPPAPVEKLKDAVAGNWYLTR
jgi:hypothetical protein